MAQTAAYQLAKRDIRVNSICPGLIETGMTDFTFEMARRRGTASKIGQLNPLGRYGVAEGTSKGLRRTEGNRGKLMTIECRGCTNRVVFSVG